MFRVRLSWSKYVALLTSDPEELGFFLNHVESAVNLDWEAPQKEKFLGFFLLPGLDFTSALLTMTPLSVNLLFSLLCVW